MRFYRLSLLVAVFVVLVWSAIDAFDQVTWLLEVAPALIGLAIIFPTHRRFPLTPLLSTLIALHMVLLAVGGHYTYARVPLGDWLSKRGWRNFLIVNTCLAISATYELFEWFTALILGQKSDEFLGTQGDPWDTQSDMFCALVGALTALVLLSKWHDVQLRRISPQAAGATPSSLP